MLIKFFSVIVTKIYKLFYGTGIGNYRPFKQFVPFVLRHTNRKYDIHTTKFGYKMWLHDLNWVDEMIIQCGEREPTITNLIFKYLKSGETFLDIGANIGYDTLLACKIVGKKGNVFAIEPNSKIFIELEKNVKLNKKILPIENITLFKVGAGKEKSNFESHYDVLNPGASSLLETSENKSFTKETIEVVRLDNLLGNKKIDFIKMDIEGFEREAIQGMEKILKHVKYMIFEYSPGMKVYNYNILDHLMKGGFALYHIKEKAEPTLIQDTKKYYEKICKKGQSDIFAIRG